jgi:hypothetical protein
MALRIKELLYEDQYTIAGAKKRLANDLRAGGKIRLGATEDDSEGQQGRGASKTAAGHSTSGTRSPEDRKALGKIASELREILSLIEGRSKNPKR